MYIMGDALNQIINVLSLSTVEKILQYNNANNSFEYSIKLNQTMYEFQLLKVNETIRQLRRQFLNVKSKVSENSCTLLKISNENKVSRLLTETFEEHLKTDGIRKRLRGYEAQIAEVCQSLGNINVLELFTDITSLNNNIERLYKDINEAQSKYHYFEDLPPNIEQAKKAIQEIKENIKSHEMLVESLLMS